MNSIKASLKAEQPIPIKNQSYFSIKLVVWYDPSKSTHLVAYIAWENFSVKEMIFRIGTIFNIDYSAYFCAYFVDNMIVVLSIKNNA